MAERLPAGRGHRHLLLQGRAGGRRDRRGRRLERGRAPPLHPAAGAGGARRGAGLVGRLPPHLPRPARRLAGSTRGGSPASASAPSPPLWSPVDGAGARPAPGHPVRHRHARHAGDRGARAGHGRASLLPVRLPEGALDPPQRTGGLGPDAAHRERQRVPRAAADRRARHRRLRRRHLRPFLRFRPARLEGGPGAAGRAGADDAAADLDLRGGRTRHGGGRAGDGSGGRHLGHHRYRRCGRRGRQRGAHRARRPDGDVRLEHLLHPAHPRAAPSRRVSGAPPSWRPAPSWWPEERPPPGA